MPQATDDDHDGGDGDDGRGDDVCGGGGGGGDGKGDDGREDDDGGDVMMTLMFSPYAAHFPEMCGCSWSQIRLSVPWQDLQIRNKTYQVQGTAGH